MVKFSVSRQELRAKSFSQVQKEVKKADKQLHQHLPYIAGVIYQILLLKETKNNGSEHS